MLVVGRRFAHLGDELFETTERRLIYPLGRGSRGDAFERRANRIDLEQIRFGDLANLRAAEWRADDKTEQLEIAQRFPNRPLTDAELLGDPVSTMRAPGGSRPLRMSSMSFSRMSSRNTRRSIARGLLVSLSILVWRFIAKVAAALSL